MSRKKNVLTDSQIQEILDLDSDSDKTTESDYDRELKYGSTIQDNLAHEEGNANDFEDSNMDTDSFVSRDDQFNEQPSTDTNSAPVVSSPMQHNLEITFIDISSPSQKVGRNKSLVWDCFETKQVNGKIISNKCKICKEEVSAKVERMKKHYEKCSKKEMKRAVPMSLHSATESAAANCSPSSSTTFLKHPKI
ncbi:uncharacterized protein LOC110861008 [Folsomia candida]|uniref:Zinc finger BED domain-containing protein RICESLEEPER 3 n=1 Tax=Folsomia candida TaxID=158441 RepID=A0A226D511_FOLCA|nr:uncharacterized protein LOC110861008 [Folsomia candida]OXA39827.1 Zinc finger BED domain-containing protein RICESLEEPER 3 [Folsomia candida]